MDYSFCCVNVADLVCFDFCTKWQRIQGVIFYISANRQLPRCSIRYSGFILPVLFPTGRWTLPRCAEATCTTQFPVTVHAVNLSVSLPVSSPLTLYLLVVIHSSTHTFFTRPIPFLSRFFLLLARKGWLGKRKKGKRYDEFCELHSPFILCVWWANKQATVEVQLSICSCLLLERRGRKKLTNLTEGRCLVCLLPYSSLPLTLLRVTLQDAFFLLVKKWTWYDNEYCCVGSNHVLQSTILRLWRWFWWRLRSSEMLRRVDW